MTSASSHRLRSAVSACAQPTHSYLSSSYLSPSIQVESHNSGGCFKKFKSSGRTGEDSPTNVEKKSYSNGDFSPLHRRHRHGLSHHRVKKNGKELENSANKCVLNLIPKQLILGNDFFSKLKFGGKLIESKRLADYLDKTARDESLINNCEKVIDGKSGRKNDKKNAGIGNNNKVLTHRHGNCNKGKSKKSRGAGKKDSINEESEGSDECSKCGVARLEGIKDDKQEISKWPPKHMLTRRTAQIVRERGNVWQSRVGSSKSVPAECSTLSNDLQLSPSASQGREMLECAKEHSGNPSARTEKFYGIQKEFIKPDKPYNVARSSPMSRISNKNDEKRVRKFSKGMSKYEVFLGGSCNPTTWRTDIAIPELEKMRISYYNPQQVEEWRPELMEAEYHAKENATVMFFVLDNQTRGVSALIEVAHLAGNQRKLILVIQSYTQKNQIICDEKISKEECEDLKGGQEVLQVLMERQGIPVFRNIQVALECTEKVLRQNLRVQDLQEPVRMNSENSISPWDVFEKLDSGNTGKISARDVCLGLEILLGVPVSDGDLKNVECKAGKELNGILSTDVRFNFEEFLEFVIEFQGQLEGLKEEMTLDSSSLSSFCFKDVYLGGTIENTSWRESIAIPTLEKQRQPFYTKGDIKQLEMMDWRVSFEIEDPMNMEEGKTKQKLKEVDTEESRGRHQECIHGVLLWASKAQSAQKEQSLSYFVPKISQGRKRFTEIEAAAMDHSFVLLFVITNTARSLAAMAIAGHYIGKGANVVLSVEHLPENATIGEEKLSESAVKDYNRGRMYLMDIAKRSDVPVFDDISTAVRIVVQKCKNR